MDPKLILIILMLGSMLFMLFLAFSGPSATRAMDRRLSAVTSRHGGADADMEQRMRKAVASRSTAKQSQILVSLIPNPENLTKRLRMTGKKWTLSQYAGACALVMIAVIGIGLFRGWAPLTALFVGTASGLILPHKYVGRLITKRVKKFTMTFPDALELMVRGLRSGLPIAETLQTVSTELPGPVGEEFRLVTERIRIGKTMDQALAETAERLGTAEFQFFCITLTIQRETGGNLAETLANLATVLRQRAQMKLKINAMSSESKASAYIIGSLPFIVFGLISWINFHYMESFYTPDPNGLFGLSLMQLVGIGGMCWMGIGVFIMAQMINFEI
ncbi:type II secretion system F family protein [Sphingobium subterraneum]|uniref:Tight adherence protein B n=1 Tax=Sphingobium subterraneum TaxID=627688 RepID=A0A841J8A9_9SPHN|nr:type II secretion system F family protein [Sphingobium subterraneum]MBB6124788.1 tight adherence protein B [Sphingobium subterraneum]